MNEVQISKIKKRADEYATSCFPYEKQFLEREAVVKCCVHVVTETIADLEKENEGLKCECRTCVYTDSPCVRSDYPSKDGVCSHYKNVSDENVELKKENKVLAQNLEDTEILNKAYEKRFSDLEKENAELDCQKNRNKFCYSCANATERCFRNEIGCPCEKYKSYKDENAELKLKLETLEGQTPWKDIKDKSEVIGQLTKAKDILNNFLNACEDYEISEVRTEAEQFIKDVEK